MEGAPKHEMPSELVGHEGEVHGIRSRCTTVERRGRVDPEDWRAIKGQREEYMLFCK